MSLRRAFILVFSALLTTLAVFASGFSYYSARKEAWSILDFQLQQISQVVGDGTGITPLRLVGGASDEVVAIRIIPHSGGSPVTNDATVTFPAKPEPAFSTFSSGNVEWRLYTSNSPERTVMVAQRTAERNELAADAAWNSAWPFLVAVPLSWIVAYWLVGAIMERLQSLASKVEARAVENTEHLPTEDAPLEVRPLIIAINRAFDRVRQTLEQQRAFLADAAHELRTPVTALSLQVDNLKHAASETERTEAVADLEAGVRRATQVATLLLRLARSESSEPNIDMGSKAKLKDIVQGCLGRFLGSADARGIDLGLAEITSSEVWVDPVDLDTILDVLVDNALRYTPEGGRIDLAVVDEGHHALIVVTDDGPGIPENLRERVFDRFYRVDPSATDGSGLGLAIARNLVTRYGGTIRLEDNPAGSGLKVVLAFPAA